MRQPESVAGLFQGAAIQALLIQAEKHRRVLDVAKRALPGFLADHCVDCVVKPDRLILYVDSPAWASQIRFYALHLLSKVQQSTGCRFNDLLIRNALPAAARPLDKPVLTLPSGFAAEVLKNSALSTSSGELKEALLRLSATVQALRNADPRKENQ
jgi:hypothetical protein